MLGEYFTEKINDNQCFCPWCNDIVTAWNKGTNKEDTCGNCCASFTFFEDMSYIEY